VIVFFIAFLTSFVSLYHYKTTKVTAFLMFITDAKMPRLPFWQRGIGTLKTREENHAYLSRVNFTLPLALITACAAARRAKQNYCA
jgi:hypothetical protein